MREYIVGFTDDADMERFERIHGTNGELIRCRNCQAWKGKECNLPEYGWCGCLQQLTHAGDYCAWSPNLNEEEE